MQLMILQAKKQDFWTSF